MKKRYYLPIGIILVLGILFTLILFYGPTTPNPPGKAPFFMSEQENFNQSVPDKESAYSILISIEPGWRHDSTLYQDYIESQPFDVEYKEIPVVGAGGKKINAYVLGDQVAIDADGQIYRRGGWI